MKHRTRCFSRLRTQLLQLGAKAFVNSHQLWFSAGPNDEGNGLFGRLEVP